MWNKIKILCANHLDKNIKGDKSENVKIIISRRVLKSLTFLSDICNTCQMHIACTDKKRRADQVG